MRESDKWTDDDLRDLEGRIRELYQQAANDMDRALDDFFNGKVYGIDADGAAIVGKSLAEKDAYFRKLVDAGKRTEADYQQWRLNQIGRGKRFEAMRDELAGRAADASQTARAYIDDRTPGIFTLNRNYEAYTIDSQTGAGGWTLYSEDAVRRMVMEDPKTMPYYPPSKAIARGIDLAYGQNQISKAVTSGILTGASIDTIADNIIQRVNGMSYTSAIRAARTAYTSAQNGGRMDAYREAGQMGIKVRREWMATKDNRTRHEHAALDGQRAAEDEVFEVNGYQIAYPGDPSAAPEMVYNCRCTLIAVLDDYPEPRGRQTYREWADGLDPAGGDQLQAGVAPVQQQASRTLLQPVAKSEDKNWNELLDSVKNAGVEYNPVDDLPEARTDDEIIRALAGGDMTHGSCASLGLAYIGQKQGMDVLDFRGGNSQSFFSRGGNLFRLSNAGGIHALHYGDVAGKSSCTLANNFLKQCETGKEYYLCVGRHASIVRKTAEGKLQYLELQSSSRSGWTDFNGNPRYTLTNRFGCSSASGHGERFDFMMDIDSAGLKTDEFRSILGYINTAQGDQRKGTYGTIK